MDGDSSQPSAASSRRSRRDTALCLTTSQPSTSSARKNSLRRTWENTPARRTIVTADLECGDFAGNERGATNFTLRDATRTLATAAKGTGLEGSIDAGLETLTGDLLNRRWRREDGTELRIDRCLIDANWGSSTDVVYQFCRQSPHAGVVLPSHGRFVGAASRSLSEYKRKPGERVGLN